MEDTRMRAGVGPTGPFLIDRWGGLILWYRKPPQKNRKKKNLFSFQKRYIHTQRTARSLYKRSLVERKETLCVVSAVAETTAEWKRLFTRTKRGSQYTWRRLVLELRNKKETPVIRTRYSSLPCVLSVCKRQQPSSRPYENWWEREYLLDWFPSDSDKVIPFGGDWNEKRQSEANHSALDTKQ